MKVQPSTSLLYPLIPPHHYGTTMGTHVEKVEFKTPNSVQHFLTSLRSDVSHSVVSESLQPYGL